jgi:hypothetical protein
VLSHDIRSRDLKLVNANILIYIKRVNIILLSLIILLIALKAIYKAISLLILSILLIIIEYARRISL